LKPVALAMPLVLVALGIYAAFGGRSTTANHANKTIRIGSKNFTEQLILGELMAQMIEAHTDLAVERRFNLAGTMICHQALVAGEIDLYAEYTGTGLVTVLKQPVETDAHQVLNTVRTEFRKQFNVEWLEPFGFNNTYALTVRKSDAREQGWQSISDLATSADSLRAGFTAEFCERADGYLGLREDYGFGFGEVHDLEPSLMYQAVAKGEVDVICAFTTDGRIAAYDLKPLADDRRFFPPYFAAPVIRLDFLQQHSEVRDVLARLSGVLDDKAMQRLNYQVDQDGRQPRAVAQEFLKEHGLLNGD
ncbi:MAG TPA: glycine betaine ABC transporter substrate-binding protein, partial [Thermoguttaceae bacterium]|nr:glycine betaine ABC transporter substrate-binding protein [Thermoguttaceae bacterium]